MEADSADEYGTASSGRMGAPRLILLVAALLWGWFALSGTGDDAAHRPYYLHIPLAMTGISLLVFAATWGRRFGAALGCAGLLLILLLAPYLFYYTGGM